MSYMASGTLGAVAVVLALGAVHLEVSAGNELLGPAQRGDASVFTPARAGTTEAIVTNVDRSAKGNRDTTVSPAGGLTLSFRLPGLPGTSVAMRVPSGEAADALRKAPAPATTGKGSSAASRPVACEPVVSVLTDVAKRLEAGRCIT